MQKEEDKKLKGSSKSAVKIVLSFPEASKDGPQCDRLPITKESSAPSG